MKNKILTSVSLFIAVYTLNVTALAQDKKQAQLDKACEEARQIALAPLKKEIYQECLQKLGQSKAACQSNADAYNGNRINGAPRFYELPACQKAFTYRGKHK